MFDLHNMQIFMYFMVTLILLDYLYLLMDSYIIALYHFYPNNIQYNHQNCLYFYYFIVLINSFFVELMYLSCQEHLTYKFYLFIIISILLFSMLLIFLYIIKILIIMPILILKYLSIFLLIFSFVRRRNNA